MDNAITFGRVFPSARLVSGWLAFEYDENETADFIQHWWNFYEGHYVDTTPIFSIAKYEYVKDMQLCHYALENNDYLDGWVASSLILKKRQFEIVTHLHGMYGTSTPTEEISCATLYRQCMRAKAAE